MKFSLNDTVVIKTPIISVNDHTIVQSGEYGVITKFTPEKEEFEVRFCFGDKFIQFNNTVEEFAKMFELYCRGPIQCPYYLCEENCSEFSDHFYSSIQPSGGPHYVRYQHVWEDTFDRCTFCENHKNSFVSNERRLNNE